jgi:hypothetical protein
MEISKNDTAIVFIDPQGTVCLAASSIRIGDT